MGLGRCSLMRKKNALPVEIVVLQQKVDVSLGTGKAKGWKNDDHKKEIPECLLHDGMILSGSCPMSQLASQRKQQPLAEEQ